MRHTLCGSCLGGRKQFTLTNTGGTEGMSPKSLTSAAGWMAFPSTGPEKTWGGNLSGESCKKSDFGFKHNNFETHPRFLHTNTALEGECSREEFRAWRNVWETPARE